MAAEMIVVFEWDETLGHGCVWDKPTLSPFLASSPGLSTEVWFVHAQPAPHHRAA